MYKCLECGEVFDNPESWRERRGEFWGAPAYEEMAGCPNCRGDYEELVACELCGEEHEEDSLTCGVCEGCFEMASCDVDLCYRIGEGQTETVQLNCFLAAMFTVDEIEALLLNALKAEKADCSAFVEEDESWFAQRLKEVKKNENSK